MGWDDPWSAPVRRPLAPGTCARPAAPGLAKMLKNVLDLPVVYGFIPFHDRAADPTPTAPDPHQDRRSPSRRTQPHCSPALPGPQLIDYGLELAARCSSAPPPPTLCAMTGRSAPDLALILARITRGLRLAGALEERLMWLPVPEETTRRPNARPPAPHPRAARPRSAARRHPRTPTRVSLTCPRRSKSPPKSAAARSAPLSPISAAISASCPATPCGGNCRSPSSADRGCQADQGHPLASARAILRDGLAAMAGARAAIRTPAGGTGPP